MVGETVLQGNGLLADHVDGRRSILLACIVGEAEGLVPLGILSLGSKNESLIKIERSLKWGSCEEAEFVGFVLYVELNGIANGSANGSAKKIKIEKADKGKFLDVYNQLKSELLTDSAKFHYTPESREWIDKVKIDLPH
jgi:hypothetical protein